MTVLIKTDVPKPPQGEPGLASPESGPEKDKQGRTLADRQSELDLIAKRANRLEDTTMVGAVSLTPKQHLLDAGDVKKDPKYHYRWVSLREPQRLESRILSGYEVVPAADGGRKLGDSYVLMRQPKELHDQAVKRLERTNKDRLSAHKTEMRGAVEAVARQLRDRGMDNHDIDRLFVDE